MRELNELWALSLKLKSIMQGINRQSEKLLKSSITKNPARGWVVIIG